MIKDENEKAAEEWYLGNTDYGYGGAEAKHVIKAYLAGCAQERERIWATIQTEVAFYGAEFMESVGVELLKGIIFGDAAAIEILEGK